VEKKEAREQTPALNTLDAFGPSQNSADVRRSLYNFWHCTWQLVCVFNDAHALLVDVCSDANAPTNRTASTDIYFMYTCGSGFVARALVKNNTNKRTHHGASCSILWDKNFIRPPSFVCRSARSMQIRRISPFTARSLCFEY
jgi:hypothetical protein